MRKRTKIVASLILSFLLWLTYTAHDEGVIYLPFIDKIEGPLRYHLQSVRFKAPNANAENLTDLRERALDSLIFIEGGGFVMGNVEIDAVNNTDVSIEKTWVTSYLYPKSSHKVILDSYYMASHEITYYDFELFLNATGRNVQSSIDRRSREVIRLAPNKTEPVDRTYSAKLTWAEADTYCSWLGELTGKEFALPTESQWEYAARSRGINVAFATDDGTLKANENIYASVYGVSGPRIPKPGVYPSNPLGLYDMTGSKGEWVSDWYDAEYYLHSPVLNPKGPLTGEQRISRGGPAGTTPSLNTVVRRSSVLEFNDYQQEYGAKSPPERTVGQNGDPIYYRGYIGARCAVNAQVPPQTSGFGNLAGNIPNDFPSPFDIRDIDIPPQRD